MLYGNNRLLLLCAIYYQNSMADDDDTNSGDGEESTPGTGQYVTHLGPYDVLLGRGTGPSMHEGNVRFRQTVEDLKPAYVSTTSRKAKKDLVRRIVTAIKAQNGRFLTKLHKSETKMLGLDMAAYEVVRDSVAFEKTKQAIRYVHYKKEPAAARSSSVSSELHHDSRKKKKRPVPRSSTAVANFKDAGTSSSSNLTGSTPSSEHFSRNPRSGDTSIADGRSVLSMSDTARLVAPDSQSVDVARLQDFLLGASSGSSSSLWNSRANLPQNQLTASSMMAAVENLLQSPTAITSTNTPYPASIGATGSIIAPSLDPVLEGLRLRQQLNNVLAGRAATTNPAGRGWLSSTEHADLKQYLESQPTRTANLPSAINQTLSLESQLQLILASSPDRIVPQNDIGWNLEQSSSQQLLGQGLPLHPLNLTQASHGLGDNVRPLVGGADHPSVHEQLLVQQQQQQLQEQHQIQQQSQLFAYLQAQEERQRIINSYLSNLPPR